MLLVLDRVHGSLRMLCIFVLLALRELFLAIVALMPVEGLASVFDEASRTIGTGSSAMTEYNNITGARQSVECLAIAQRSCGTLVGGSMLSQRLEATS